MPGDIVSNFISAIELGRLDAALALLADDCEYDNVPLGAVTGPNAVRDVLGPFLARFEEVSWVVEHQVASGSQEAGVVMNERRDRFRSGDSWAEIAVAGLFVLRHGRIVLWRDYFDLGQFRAAFPPPAS